MKKNLLPLSVLRIFKYIPAFTALVFAAMLNLVSCSAGKEEGSISIALPSRTQRSIDGQTITVFITGDYVAKKTVAMPSSATAGVAGSNASATVTFDSIPSGSKISVACAIKNSDGFSGAIGVSDEITIIGGTEQTAHVTMQGISLGNSFTPATAPYVSKLYYTANPSAPDFECISLPPSCTYKFTLRNDDNGDWYYYTLSTALCNSSELANIGVPASRCDVTTTILCNGTEVLSLFINAW
ncbi:MAG: hypothetical protein IIT57_09135 [Treponema sp.]|nr:hypothetical protein [Treponema sp.]